MLQSMEKNSKKALLSPAQLSRLNEHGYIVIDNFLPQELHDSLLKDLESRESKIHYQIRPAHYSHVYSSGIKTLPQAEEPYISKFSVIHNRQESKPLNQAFYEHFAPIMKEASEYKIKYSLFPPAVRIRGGDVYRAHQDGYAGVIGFSFFLNSGWCWDYGGILTYVRGEDEAETIFPRSNRLLLRNETFKHFHFLNSVEQYSPKEQYIVLAWADVEKGADSVARGEYVDI